MFQIKKNKTRIIITILIFILAITMVVPFVWMISASFKVEADVFKFPIQWIPKRWNAISNYSTVWGSEYNFGLYYLNSIKVTFLTTFFQVVVSATAGFAFAKIDFKFKNRIFLVLLATMMIPEQVTIVPTFMILNKLNLYNTHAGIILICSFSIFGIFFLRQYMTTIPDSLIEAAKIDGASYFTIFYKIILPISKPAISTLVILKFVWTWNDYQHPLIFLSSQKLFTIQLGMKSFVTDYTADYALMMAASVSAILPLIIIFIIGQKNVIEGITGGAVKG
ncbi:MAG: carbohydrate ABC transporter permease [Clostridium sp.]|uniref:carbohydrate ABC transporter permease n=1 Tax=Clostridium sp. TaxID=1506 RepID=UPI003D6DA57F